MAQKQPFGIVDIVLIIVILGLTTALWWVIWSPGEYLRFMDDMKWESRARMSALRSAEIEYFNLNQRYSDDLDTLVYFFNTEVATERRDSIFTKLYISAFSFDSLRVSPLKRLPYEITIDDTSAIKRYQIDDPDGFGSIGSITNPDNHNKASWEQ